jgi:hypothetical protein
LHGSAAEVDVKTTGLLIALVAVMVLGCNREGATNAAQQTNTIQPAKPKPAATGTDAMTLTVDIEDSRSEAEGAGLTETTTASTDTSTTATAVRRKTGAAAASRKQPVSQSKPPGRTQ